MENQDLRSALKHRVGKDGVFSYDDDSYLYAKEDSEDDAMTILNYLPEVVQDHLAMAKAVTGLLKVVAQQQFQIEELSERLENSLRAKIGVQVQENMQDLIRELVAQGRDVTKVEAIVKIDAEVKTEEETKTKARTESSEDTATAIRGAGELGGVAAILAKLNLIAEVSRESLSEVKQLVTKNSHREMKQRYRGDTIIRIGSITTPR
jgi:hypothetical protein